MRFSYTARMKHEYAARHLPIAAFAQAGADLVGEERLAHFVRLLDETCGLGAETLVSYAVHGSMRVDAAGVDEPWLHLEAEAVLPLTCQRCLGPVDVPVSFARDFRFVATEALAEVEDEESEEDVLVLSKSFDLLELVEDELLMAMPAVPKHDTCPQAIKLQAVDPDFVDAPAEKPNPFAVLEQLKKGAK